MINLTPHPITLRTPAGDVTLPPSGTVARVVALYEQVGEVAGVPVMRRTWGAIEGLPPVEQRGQGVIVSSLVLEALDEECAEGVYAPDTGPTAIREDGKVVAVTRLIGA